ncbi:unnamed protein product [Victoria cruziana]
MLNATAIPTKVYQQQKQ